jgi:peroxiredoxin
MVKKSNSRYSAMKSIDSYFENYRYRSVPQIGDSFFEFHARQTDGKIFDSRTVSGKVIVLFFWYSGCGPCHRAMPELCDLYDKYKSKGLDVISFSLDTKEEEWIKQSQRNRIPGINVSDLVGFSSQQFLHYGVTAFPFFVVFDRNKKLSMVTFGEDEVPLIESKIKELLDRK